MSTEYSGSTANFPDTVTIVSHGDADKIAEIEDGLNDLADRTAWLKPRTTEADGLGILNMQVPIVVDSAAAALDLGYARADGTNTTFWSNTFRIWFRCGYNLADGKVYVGDSGFFRLFDTSAASPIKTSFGCDSGLVSSPGRVCLFNSDSVAGSPHYLLDSGGADYTGTWSRRTLTASAFSTFVRPVDAATTSTQKMIVVGGGDPGGVGKAICWKSTDNGFSFSEQQIASGLPLTRIIVGKVGGFETIITWIRANSANQGDRLFYSQTDGNTWASRSGIGFDTIIDGVYLPGLDLWAFATGSTIYTTSNPISGAFTAHATGSVTALGGVGRHLLWGVDGGSLRQELYMSSDGLDTAPKFVGRDPYAGATIAHIAASPWNQLAVASNSSIRLSSKVSA